MNSTTDNSEVMKYQYRLGHEFYIRLCLLDDIFKYEILDIDTITDIHYKLKKYFIKYHNLDCCSKNVITSFSSFSSSPPYDSTIDILLRKYLEFFKIIKPINKSNNNTLYYEEDCSIIVIPILLGEHIKSLIMIGDCYLECILKNDYYYNFNVNLYMA